MQRADEIERYTFPSNGNGFSFGLLMVGLLSFVAAAVCKKVSVAGVLVFGGITLAVAMVSLRIGLRYVEVSRDGLRVVRFLGCSFVPVDEIVEAVVLRRDTLELWGMLLPRRVRARCSVPPVGLVRLIATEKREMALVTLRSGPPLLIGVHFTRDFAHDVNRICRGARTQTREDKSV